MSAHRKDITGKRFGMLVALSRSHKVGGKWVWSFMCDCGKECHKRAERVASDLERGRTPNCGCYTALTIKAERTSHAMTQHRAYRIWRSMKQRCVNPLADQYKNYGGRGIKVCPEWESSFETFWACMGPTYSPGLQIDRIDTNGDYSPENCRWVTAKENCRNKRNNRRIKTPWGVLPIAEAAELAGVHYETVRSRLHHGWDSISAVTTPVGAPHE